MSDTATPVEVYDALSRVEDPELGIDVVSLGLVYDVSIEESAVTVLMTLTTIGCPAAEEIELRARQEVGALTGVARVEVKWTFQPPWSPDRISEEGRDLLIALGYL
jgi:metal-sulfur cluster biosynthetic enzyme